MLRVLLLLSFLLPYSVRGAETTDSFNWQLSIGSSISHNRYLLEDFDSQFNGVPSINGQFSFEYKNWFMEPGGSISNFHYGNAVLGYRLTSLPSQDFSLLFFNAHLGFGPSVRRNVGQKTPGLTGLQNRSGDFFAGFRYQFFFSEKQHVSLRAGKDLVAHYSYLAALSYSTVLELKNWDLYLNAEFSWYNQKLMAYYWGIDPADSAANFPLYQPRQGWRQHFGVVGVYPLKPKWLVELGTGVNYYSTAHTDSPLTRQNPELLSFIMLKYVIK